MREVHLGGYGNAPSSLLKSEADQSQAKLSNQLPPPLALTNIFSYLKTSRSKSYRSSLHMGINHVLHCNKGDHRHLDLFIERVAVAIGRILTLPILA